MVRREIVYIADMEIPALLYWQLDDDKCISYVDPGVFSYVTTSKKWPNPATYLNTQTHKKRFLCLLYFPKARFKLLDLKTGIQLLGSCFSISLFQTLPTWSDVFIICQASWVKNLWFYYSCTYVNLYELQML